MTEETHQVILRPSFTGIPNTCVSWFKNGKQLSSNDDYIIKPDGSLYLPCVKKEQAGMLVNNIIYQLFSKSINKNKFLILLAE